MPSGLSDPFLGFRYILKSLFSQKLGATNAGVLPWRICYSNVGDFRFQTAGSEPLEMSVYSLQCLLICTAAGLAHLIVSSILTANMCHRVQRGTC